MTSMKVRVLATSLSLAGPAALALADDPFPPAKPEEVGVSPAALDAMMREVRRWIADDKAVGAEIHVIKNRRTILHEGVGFADREEKKPVVPNTLACIRSMTKPLVGTAIQMLVEEKKLSLDDPVSKFLPSFANEKSRAITVRHLLEHMAGFRYTTMDKGLDAYRSARDVADQAGGIGPAFPPGTAFSYSDADTETLTAILEIVAGAPAAMFVQKRVLDPLGMSDTYPVLGASRPDRSRVSSAYAGSAGAWTKYWAHGDPPIFKYFLGSQSAHSTTTDYARLLAMWMDLGKVGDRRILSEDSVRRALTGSMPMLFPGDPPGHTPEFGTVLPPKKIFYGQHWMVWTTESKRPDGALPTFGHGGSDGTGAWAFPEQNLIVLYFTQSRGGLTSLEFEDLIPPLLGLEPPKAAAEASKRPSDAEIAALLGGYHDDESGTFPWVVRQGERVAIEFPGQGVLALDWPDASGSWKALAVPGMAVKFDRDDAGAVVSITLLQGEAHGTLPRLKPVADLPSVDAVLALRREKNGGERLDRLKRLRIAGSMEIGPTKLHATVTTFVEGTDRSVSRVAWAGAFEDTIVDGGKAWKLRPNAAPEEQDASTLEAARLGNAMARLGDWRRAFSKVEVVRKQTIGDEEAWVLRLEPATLPTMTRYVGSKTGRLLREEAWIQVKGLGIAPAVTEFTDFRDVGGIPFAFHSVADRGPRLGKVTVSIDEIQLDPEIPPDAFALKH
jgi:CubicO group peptidase (beta-lactamase class C family)